MPNDMLDSDQTDDLDTDLSDPGDSLDTPGGDSDPGDDGTDILDDGQPGDAGQLDAQEDGAEDPGSLTPPNTPPNPSSQRQPQPAPDDARQRYEEFRRFNDRRFNEERQRRAALEQEIETLRQFREEQMRKAEEQKLRRWMPRHPEYGKFRSMMERAKAIRQQIRAIPQDLSDDAKAAARAAILAGIRPEEAEELNEYRAYTEEFQENLIQDPVGTLLPILMPEVERAIQSRETQLQARFDVQRDFQDPTIAPVIKEHAEDFKAALDAGVPYSYAVHMTKMFAEIKRLQSEISSLRPQVVRGQAQARIARTRATDTPTPATPEGDPYEMAKAEAARRGIALDSNAFFALIRKFSQP